MLLTLYGNITLMLLYDLLTNRQAHTKTLFSGSSYSLGFGEHIKNKFLLFFGYADALICNSNTSMFTICCYLNKYFTSIRTEFNSIIDQIIDDTFDSVYVN